MRRMPTDLPIARKGASMSSAYFGEGEIFHPKRQVLLLAVSIPKPPVHLFHCLFCKAFSRRRNAWKESFS